MLNELLSIIGTEYHSYDSKNRILFFTNKTSTSLNTLETYLYRMAGVENIPKLNEYLAKNPLNEFSLDLIRGEILAIVGEKKEKARAEKLAAIQKEKEELRKQKERDREAKAKAKELDKIRSEDDMKNHMNYSQVKDLTPFVYSEGVNRHSKSKTYGLINLDTGEISPTDISIWEGVQNVTVEKILHTKGLLSVKPIYSPYKPAIEHIDENFIAVNRYKVPAWKTIPEYEEIPDDRLPEDYAEFLEWLIPLPEEREYVLHWVYRSIVDRAPVYLMLVGPGGSGKSLFVRTIAALHGENFTFGSPQLLTERFNSNMSETSFIIFDEMKFTLSQEHRLKEYQNGKFSIEAKGIDATRQSENHASMVMISNNDNDIKFPPDARKYAPLVMAGADIKTVWPIDKVSKLYQKYNGESNNYDVKAVCQIGKYILKNCAFPHKWPGCEYKGPAFYRISSLAAPKEIKLITKVFTKAETDPKDSEAFNKIDEVKSQKAKYGGYVLFSMVVDVKKHIGKTLDKSKVIIDVDRYEDIRKSLEIHRNKKGIPVFDIKDCNDPTVNYSGDFLVKLNDEYLRTIKKEESSPEDLL